MKTKMTSATRNANELFNQIIREFGLKSDSALSRALEVSPSVISKIRTGSAPFTDNMLIVVHDATGMSIKELKTILREGLPALPPTLQYRQGSNSHAFL